MQLSANRLKWLTSLQQKKFRDEHRLFIAEGKKVVHDLVANGWQPHYIVVEEGKEDGADGLDAETAVADAIRMKKISSLSTPPGLLAVFPLPETSVDQALWQQPVSLLLDGISDPGNMGTILRTAHWFGVKEIFMAHHCTDPFAAKVVQATMGSLAKVDLFTVPDSFSFGESIRSKSIRICIADMNGTHFRAVEKSGQLLLVMGSESHGVSDVWRQLADVMVQIPPAVPADHPESLNVSVSTAVLLSHFCA